MSSSQEGQGDMREDLRRGRATEASDGDDEERVEVF